MHKLEITLKQHTPLIHFQHEQEGATLRATEVKPKLDRFILTKLGDGDYEKGKVIAKEKNWLVGKGDKPALDYKMRITAENVSSQPIYYQSTRDGKFSPKYPFIFGNVDTKAEQKVFSVCKSLKIKILTFNETLEIEINKSINHFFAVTNFGFRQDKGFGSFFLANATLSEFEKNLKGNDNYFLDKRIFKRVIQVQGNNEFEKTQFLFRQLDKQYKILKSGFGDTKSKLQEYFMQKQKPLVWEKESIKQRKVENNDRYLRILLGLADNFEYPKQNMKVDIADKNNEIERFQSPLTFKIFENNVYLLYPSKINERIINQTFKFILKNTRNNSTIKELELPTIKTGDNISGKFYYEFLRQKLNWKEL
ncbi:MAG: hypothetical protein LBS69_06545 [Prevotellaceae bacterium]|jgi:hypothetical protein|nr:hypothetical protein [Prevotellaceae bacterium]